MVTRRINACRRSTSTRPVMVPQDQILSKISVDWLFQVEYGAWRMHLRHDHLKSVQAQTGTRHVSMSTAGSYNSERRFTYLLTAVSHSSWSTLHHMENCKFLVQSCQKNVGTVYNLPYQMIIPDNPPAAPMRREPSLVDERNC